MLSVRCHIAALSVTPVFWLYTQSCDGSFDFASESNEAEPLDFRGQEIRAQAMDPHASAFICAGPNLPNEYSIHLKNDIADDNILYIAA